MSFILRAYLAVFCERVTQQCQALEDQASEGLKVSGDLRAIQAPKVSKVNKAIKASAATKGLQALRVLKAFVVKLVLLALLVFQVVTGGGELLALKAAQVSKAPQVSEVTKALQVVMGWMEGQGEMDHLAQLAPLAHHCTLVSIYPKFLSLHTLNLPQGL